MSLIKLAVSRWGRFLQEAESHTDLGNRIAKLTRSTNMRPDIRRSREASGLLDSVLGIDKKTALKDSIKKAKIRVKGQWESPGNPDFLHHSINGTGKDKHYWFKKHLERKNDSNARIPFGGEEYHNIHHGGELHRIKAQLEGNSAYPMEASAKLHGGGLEHMGIQVHSEFSGRAPRYAQRSGVNRFGTPATLTGRIKGKYLFNNNGFSGGGDEYGIPKEYLKHIENSHIQTLKHDHGAALTIL